MFLFSQVTFSTTLSLYPSISVFIFSRAEADDSAVSVPRVAL